MIHEEIRHKLSEYIDESVTPEERMVIEEHLKTCTACSDALAELRKTIEHIHAVEEVESPAWMTQKIMATVRTGAKEKKGLFHRLFYPLAVKLPLQTVAILFLAVTAFYIFEGINPRLKYAEAPMERMAKKEEPTPHLEQNKHAGSDDAKLRANKIPQAPEYKSLDMKYEYEKPAPPVPRGQIIASSPAPAKSAEQPAAAGKATTFEEHAVVPKATAPSLMAEQAAQQSVKSPAGRSSGVSKDIESKKEMVSAEYKAMSTFRVKSYLEFIRTIERFPYEAPRSKKDRIVNNYGKLMTGMTKKEIVFIIGEPDYSTNAQALDPPYRQQGTYWTYDLYIKNPNLVSLDMDQYFNIFFDVHEKAYSFSPHNIPGLARKGEGLNTSK